MTLKTISTKKLAVCLLIALFLLIAGLVIFDYMNLRQAGQPNFDTLPGVKTSTENSPESKPPTQPNNSGVNFAGSTQ